MTLRRDTPALSPREGSSPGRMCGRRARVTCAIIEGGAARGLSWDVEAAKRALGFFPDVLRLSEGQFEGEPFNLHPAQEFIVGSLFGWKREDGTRRFRRAYIEQGKGNGKSPLAGGIGLYGLVADNEPGAQIFAAAAKMDQARILFNDAVSMVRQSPQLEKRLTPTGINPVNNLAWMEKGSFFRPVGRDTGKTGSGMRPHFVLIDELHEHPNRDTLEMLERGFKFRRQPLVFMITNSGSDRNSVCWEEHEHAVRVAHGEVEDDTTFSYVCALDEGEDPLDDPSCWVKANPLLGVTITEAYLADVAAQARAIPGKANGIRRLHFCQWTDAESAWIARETWEACEDPAMTLDEFDGQECWIGLDLGATKDMTARAMVFRDGEDGEGRPKLALFAHGYTPGDTLLGRERDDRAPYSVWVDQGHLTATPGKVVRFDQVAADIVDLAARFEVAAVAYDRWLIRNFEQTLDEMGVTLPLMEHPQGTNRRKDSPLWMPESIGQFEELLLEGRLRIAVNPALRSAVASSTFWISPAGLRRFEKQRASARIDLAVAAAMAIGAALVGEPAEDRSYLEAADMMVL
jgi:phage terminase large subunit-like protein